MLFMTTHFHIRGVFPFPSFSDRLSKQLTLVILSGYLPLADENWKTQTYPCPSLEADKINQSQGTMLRSLKARQLYAVIQVPLCIRPAFNLICEYMLVWFISLSFAASVVFLQNSLKINHACLPCFGLHFCRSQPRIILQFIFVILKVMIKILWLDNHHLTNRESYVCNHPTALQWKHLASRPSFICT